jgi:hypothetical protein
VRPPITPTKTNQMLPKPCSVPDGIAHGQENPGGVGPFAEPVKNNKKTTAPSSVPARVDSLAAKRWSFVNSSLGFSRTGPQTIQRNHNHSIVPGTITHSITHT